jgi:hypothetical protein
MNFIDDKIQYLRELFGIFPQGIMIKYGTEMLPMGDLDIIENEMMANGIIKICQIYRILLTRNLKILQLNVECNNLDLN